MMDDIFKGSDDTLRWAISEIQKFDAAVTAFLSDSPCTVVSNPNPLTGGIILSAVNIKEPTDEMRRAAYRIVNDLKNALDHASHAASCAVGTKFPKYTNFPFAQTEHDFNQRLASPKGPYRGIPCDLHDVLRTFAPYWTKDDGSDGNKLLKSLNEIANPNKHQVPLGTVLRSGPLGIRTMIDCTVSGNVSRISKSEIQILTSEPTGPNPQLEVETPFTIALEDDRPTAELSAVRTFKNFADLVSSIIIAIKAGVDQVTTH